ncbi:MAG TPA: thioesterase family protein [Steroidobacteraceae bacterium]|nr:thioesterase family protein [Steroidobacteraceae bacterium]
MAGLPIYRTAILPEWIDYNGHLRDAYYTLIVSLASDALMDRIGMDAAYRERTGGTLFTLEMHLHYLHEVTQTDTAIVNVRIIGTDRKRIHAAFELLREGKDGVAATAEVMLLHVQQTAGKAVTSPFPPEVAAALAELQAASTTLEPSGPLSRRMELRSPTRTA